MTDRTPRYLKANPLQVRSKPAQEEQLNPPIGEPSDRIFALRREFFELQDEMVFHCARLRSLNASLKGQWNTSRRFSKDLNKLTADLAEEEKEVRAAAISGGVGTLLAAIGATSEMVKNPELARSTFISPLTRVVRDPGKLESVNQLIQGGVALGGFGAVVAEFVMDTLWEQPKVTLNALESGVVGISILGTPAGVILDKIQGKPGVGLLITAGIALVNMEIQVFQFLEKASEHEDVIEHLEFILESMSKDLALAYESEDKIALVGEAMLKLAFEIRLKESAM